MNAKLTALAERQGDVFSYQDARACGYTVSQVRERVRSRRWRRLCRGQYTAVHPDPDLPAWEQAVRMHRLRTLATVRSLAGEVAVSHQSAVVEYGLPTWGLDLDTVHVTRRDAQSGRKAKGVVQHHAQLTAGAVWLRDDLQVVTPARAIVEIACSTGFEPALAIADEALREGVVSVRALEFAACDAVNWPGGPAAQEVVAFCDARSGSVGESRLRVLMDRQGLPAPVLQAPMMRDGKAFAYVDFHFGPPYNTVVEFDGRQKYADDTADVLLQEKRREDAIRELGNQFVRVVWSDLGRPRRTAARIGEAFARAATAAAPAAA